MRAEMTKYTSEDVAELANTIQQAEGRFIFLTGAGMSISAGIPAASGIIQEIHQKFPQRFDRMDAKSKWDYSLCMQKLPPSERKRLLSAHLANSKINWAHIALAGMIKANLVKRVVTFNFDNILARACGLLGQYLATYDYGVAPNERTDFIADPSIVHLHGQGPAQVMKNSQIESENHAKKLEPLVADIFADNHLIVLGYSGRTDHIFPLLEKYYTGETHIYWIGHREEPEEHLLPLMKRDYCHYLGGADADRFMIDLAQELYCFPPEVIADPANHLIAELAEVTPFPLEKIDASKDILSGTIERLREHQGSLKLTLVQSAVLLGRPEDIITQNEDSLEYGDRKFLESKKDSDIHAWAHFSKGYRLSKSSEKANDLELLINATAEYSKAVSLKPDFAEALNNWGIVLAKQAWIQQDISLFTQAVEKFQRANQIKQDDPGTLNNWGNTLSDLAKIKQDENLFIQACEKYQRANELRPDSPGTFNNWGNSLANLAALRQDESLFVQAIEKYERANQRRENHPGTFNNWGNALTNLAKLMQDEDLFRQAVEKFERANSLSPDDPDTFQNWGNALTNLAKLKQDEDLFKLAIEKFEHANQLTQNRSSALEE